VSVPSAPDFVGIVVAAGRSTRFSGPGPKQFERLGHDTLVDRAVDALAGADAVRGVIVVLPEADVSGPRGRALARRPKVLRVVPGGATRDASVRCGLDAVEDARYVLVHDAARPFASPALVQAVVAATREFGAAVPGLAIPDTVKRVEPVAGRPDAWRVVETVDRARLRLSQTPQGARTDWLRDALARAAKTGASVTDEAAALELGGRAVAVVCGETHNRKVTSPEDLAEARARIAESDGPRLRVGSGFDIHRFEAGRRLVLGGVEFPGETGLAGHSDADVVLHAAMDALLGAGGLGDIGGLFPPGDARFRDADSRVLTADVARRIGDAGLRVVNLDLTVLAERPRIGPRAEEMRRAIAGALGIEVSRIGVKATTLEGLGALGRSEGIACQAVALVERVRDGA
jgi:2-C-methyl-D-erythritol 4-phosphate cytidylyltransferase/2-C-methyl-D-erythritol 2,4-cyclodiphosphate synthase